MATIFDGKSKCRTLRRLCMYVDAKVKRSTPACNLWDITNTFRAMCRGGQPTPLRVQGTSAPLSINSLMWPSAFCTIRRPYRKMGP
jgi:hypothetical protein